MTQYLRRPLRGSHSSGRRGSPFKVFLMTLFLCALCAAGYVLLHDLEGPTLVMTPDCSRVSPDQDLVLDMQDNASGVKSVTVSVRYSGETTTIFEQHFPEILPSQKVSFNLKRAGLKDGHFNLEIVARDASLAGLGQGNSTTLTRSLSLDTQPPRITVRSTAPSLRKGSVTVFAYTLSEDVVRTGVQVGDIFFPAHLQDNGLHVCFVAFPITMTPEQFVPDVIAEDPAGNIGRTRLRVHVQDRAFRSDKLNLSDSFFTQKALSFEEILPGGNMTTLERYIKINSEVRAQNEATLHELAKKTSSRMLWSGAFQRLPRSALRASFGDARTYLNHDHFIDHQVHMGIDLASLAASPIPAANSGIVIFAAPLGIFGNLVVVDHGLGRMSLYSHLSQILVREGDAINKGDILGYTGTTGLAGGDHLHFGILLNGYQVQPIDWLDKNWIQNTITGRIESAAKR